MKYDDYIKFNELLALQEGVLEIAGKDEVIFIVVHQVSELLLKVLHAEFDGLEQTDSPDAAEVAVSFGKANEILTSLIGQLRLCRYVSPDAFFAIREKVYPASAYESLQFKRLLQRVLSDENGVPPLLWQRISGTLKSISSDLERQHLLKTLGSFKELMEQWQQEHIELTHHFLGNGVGAQSNGVQFLKERGKVKIFPELIDVAK
jgi:tryptophan 2,3-dioxygenase